jgi:mycothiol system anti-sigma-R factor
MDCGKADRRMYHYLDGEITVWRRWRITRHLNRCPPCANGFDFEVELRQVIATRCRDEVPDDLRQRIKAALDQACSEHDGASGATKGAGRTGSAADRSVE